ncbi:MAG: type II secretion system protein [Alphaproteobacteria bacterium]|nr:type II secretion system protein [Alphaproteobacteria bacterium]
MLKKSQIGRSMIEMLGVLAIIGVLSVGGLAGYSRAMRANKMNNALDYMNRCYTVVRSIGDGMSALDANGAPAASAGSITCSTLLGETAPQGSNTDVCKRRAGGRTGCEIGWTSEADLNAMASKVGISTLQGSYFSFDSNNMQWSNEHLGF